MLSDAVLAPDPARLEAVRRAWENLIGTGPTLRASQRHAVISAARAAWQGRTLDDGADPMQRAAHWLAVDAGGLTQTTVEELTSSTMDLWQYLEVVGVVGRLANVDFYARGIGATIPPLAEAVDAEPTGERHPDAEITDAWVPMTRPASAPFVLDALPGEGKALRDLHEPMYIDFKELGNGAYADMLTRVQIEWVAARSSYLNECFY